MVAVIINAIVLDDWVLLSISLSLRLCPIFGMVNSHSLPVVPDGHKHSPLRHTPMPLQLRSEHASHAVALHTRTDNGLVNSLQSLADRMVPMESRQSMVRTCMPTPHVAEHSDQLFANQLVSADLFNAARRAA